MRLITAIVIALLPSLALAQPLPKPPGPGGSCPNSYTSPGSFCVPHVGARDALVRTPGPGAARSVCAAAVGADC
jgi:hypothetical protein